MAVEIRTDRLTLRPLELADAARIRALCGEFAVARWLARAPLGNGPSLRIQEKPGFRITGRRMMPCLSPGGGRAHVDTALCRAEREALQ